ncbi:MAG: hypothetical protein PHO08_07845 [Methylococcales bacterium]|nr:hypothetical protein [Methylococcales bacterium]
MEQFGPGSKWRNMILLPIPWSRGFINSTRTTVPNAIATALPLPEKSMPVWCWPLLVAAHLSPYEQLAVAVLTGLVAAPNGTLAGQVVGAALTATPPRAAALILNLPSPSKPKSAGGCFHSNSKPAAVECTTAERSATATCSAPEMSRPFQSQAVTSLYARPSTTKWTPCSGLSIMTPTARLTAQFWMTAAGASSVGAANSPPAFNKAIKLTVSHSRPIVIGFITGLPGSFFLHPASFGLDALPPDSRTTESIDS